MEDVVELGELGWMGSERTELALDPTPEDTPGICKKYGQEWNKVSTRKRKSFVSCLFFFYRDPKGLKTYTDLIDKVFQALSVLLQNVKVREMKTSK